MKPAILTPLGASVFEQTTPRLATPASGQDSNGSGRLFQPFAMSSAHARPGWQTPPPLIKCALRPRSTEFMRFPRRRFAPWLRPRSSYGHSPEVFAVAPGVGPSLAMSKHGPSLGGGMITLDDASFTIKLGARRELFRPRVAPAGSTLS